MILEYSFFQHALAGGLLAAVLCAMIGTYMVTRRLVIAGGGMAHASLGGVGAAAFFGASPLLGAALAAVATGFGIKWLGRNRKVREDSAVAMLWTLGMATGIIFAYLTPGFMTDLPAYLFGDILAVSLTDLYRLGALTFITLAAFVIAGRAVEAVACDADFARTRGLPVAAVENVMMVLTALTIVACLHIVGIIMVISLLSVPQMTAALFARTFTKMISLSALFGFIGCVGGLTLSYVADVPGGASIIVVSIAFYLACRAIKALQIKFSDK